MVVLEAEAADVAVVGAVVTGAAAGVAAAAVAALPPWGVHGVERGSDDTCDRDFDHRGWCLLVG